MKIDYKNYPILEKLHLGSMGTIPVMEIDKFFFDIRLQEFTKCWKLFKDGFKEEINIVTKPFLDASKVAKNKLLLLMADIMKNDLDDFIVKGTYILGDFVCMVNYVTKQGSDIQEVAFYIFDKRGVPLAMNVMSTEHDINEIIWISNACQTEIKNKDDAMMWIKVKLFDVFVFKMFKTYASVETKILLPNQKVMDIVCKYKNDTKFKLTFLDSKWFTNLVKSDGFTVRGHFRLQPKKINGEMSKELIWISDFQKTGYTAPARMLS